jgi:hypothetical protein
MLFVADVINEALRDEISWPSAERRAQLGRMIRGMPGCIGHVDGTLCKIPRPRIPLHKRYYNNRKKMYCFNSTVIIDNEGFFIFVDAGFAGSFHDIRCLKQSDVYMRWRQYFSTDEEWLEYVLGDPGYMGAEMFVMRRIDNRERNPADLQNPVINAFNKRHAAERVKVEWGIGGLKNRFRRFLGCCPTRRKSFSSLFRCAAILTNFIHRRRRDFRIDNVGIVPAQEHEDVDFENDWGIM